MTTNKTVSSGSKPLDINHLRAAIPQSCFRPSTLRSTFHIILNILLILLLASLTPLFPSTPFSAFLWMAYTYTQGLLLTGLWILAHECGHGALYHNNKTNDTLGFILHSFLLVPYWSWKHTHTRHHRYTNHLEKDTVFVPSRSESQSLISKLMHAGEDAPAFVFLALVVHQVFGLPVYLLTYATGAGVGVEKGVMSHFSPWSSLFAKSQRGKISLSTAGVALMLSGLMVCGRRYGFGSVMLLYGIPYLWTNHWIVAITYLHHTHPALSHYTYSSFRFVNGALATVDRPSHWLFRFAFHGILDWHFVHHLFSRIPFYHAQEATEALKPLLGEKYVVDERPLWRALWETFVECRLLEENPERQDVLQWKSAARSNNLSR